ncbi:chromosome condensation protein [Neorhodopirellula lusitana]|uniref:chromosome condensation protein n=1 Tax=Neorhodopirellula lusitana TaxID=445327 RepID=UPI00384C7EC2
MFEDYMVWDDRSEYPMTFAVQMELSGDLNRDAFRAALAKTLLRHPLLQAIVGPGKGGRDCWIAAPDSQVEINWGCPDTAIDLPTGEAIDIRKQIGLRIWVRGDQEHSVVTMQFHHASCDGIGAYQFIGDWLWFYASEVGVPIDQPLPEFDAQALRARIKNSYDVANYNDDSGKFDGKPTRELGIKCLAGVQPLAKPKPAEPKTGSTQTATTGSFPGMCSFEFDAKTYRELRRVGEVRGQSTNELLIERLLVTLRNWNEDNGRLSRKDFCIMMPMDLREIQSRMATAANLVTYALIRRKPSQCVESESLNDSLREEMLSLKHTRQRTPFMNLVAFLRPYPAWLKRWIASRRCMATAIVSNTGDPTKRFITPLPREKQLLRAGNLLMTDIYGVPPMRSGTRLTISIFTYRRVLKICLRCDPHHFNAAQTQSFADSLEASIASLIKKA